jgi:hypothetical protein
MSEFQSEYKDRERVSVRGGGFFGDDKQRKLMKAQQSPEEKFIDQIGMVVGEYNGSLITPRVNYDELVNSAEYINKIQYTNALAYVLGNYILVNGKISKEKFKKLENEILPELQSSKKGKDVITVSSEDVLRYARHWITYIIPNIVKQTR